MSATHHNAPIPVTLLSGALGAGKTTLIKHLLGTPDYPIAIIENEFAPTSIDGELLGDDAATVVPLSNGCICCAAGDDLERALITLVERRERGELAFAHVIIECSGMADPGPIAQTLLSDAIFAAEYRLDGIVTLVDAVHAGKQLETPLHQAQVGLADCILITKTDCVEHAALAALQQRLGQLNQRACLHCARFGQVPANELLNLGGFELPSAPDALTFTPILNTSHQHHDRISSLVLNSTQALSIESLTTFMDSLLSEHAHQLLRYKGILSIAGHDERLVFQGVFGLYSFDWDRPWGDESRESVIVFIGEDLPAEKLNTLFQQALLS